MIVIVCNYYVWVLQERSSVTTSISLTNMFFILKNMVRVERHVIVEFVLRKQLLMS